MADTTEVERFEPYTDEGNREGYGQMELCENGDWVRATDYDALAADIAESEGNGDLAHALHQLSQVKAKLAEVEAERDEWKEAATRHHPNPTDFRYWEGRYRDEKARAEAAEARIAHLENHIEGVAKDTHKIMVAAEAKLPTVYLLGLADAAWVAAGIASQYVGYMSRVEKGICALPTPTATELKARIQTGEKE